MRKLTAFAVLGLCVVARGRADTDDDTLVFQLAKAELVIAAKLAREPIGFVWASGVVHYSCELQNVERLAGTIPMEAQATTPPSSQPALPNHVAVVRFEDSAADRTSFLKAGARLILFLKRQTAGSIPAWSTSDMWFGAQPYSESLARSVRRLAEPNPRVNDPLAEVAFWQDVSVGPVPEPDPRPPVPTTRLRRDVYGEFGHRPGVLEAFAKLSPRRPSADWHAGLAELERARAVACLELALCHPSHGLQREALAALGRVNDRKVVPFLLVFANYLADGGGGEQVREGLHAELMQAMRTITGVPAEGPDRTPISLRNAIAAWQSCLAGAEAR